MTMIGLLCDDESIVKETLAMYLNQEDIQSDFASDGEEALRKFKEKDYDFMVLDLMMPKINGLDVCKEVRKTSQMPILMLTARGEEIDRILGFELGADDYIVKPFSSREVVARIKAILRRTQNQSLEDKMIKQEKLMINLATYTVSYDGVNCEMTPKEVEIIHLLASHPQQVFSREQLLNNVWGYTYYGDTRSVDTHIKRIRSKMPAHLKDIIRTVYGVGYKFEAVK
jgi:DNA-binding response OmpR family regulator